MTEHPPIGPSDDDPTGWFDRLYAAAGHGEAVVPWDRGMPHPLVAEWVAAHAGDGAGRRAAIVGAGPAYDAELVAGRGFATVAFDIAPTAVRAAQERSPGSPVQYVVADLLDLPEEWIEAYDLVVECLTVQSLPDPPRRDAIAQVGRLVARGGTLLVVAHGRPDGSPEPDGPPWPLTRAEIDAFARDDLRPARVEWFDATAQTGPRWRAELRRQAVSAVVTGPERSRSRS
jgi:SAM-dependent methyltransferase